MEGLMPDYYRPPPPTAQEEPVLLFLDEIATTMSTLTLAEVEALWVCEMQGQAAMPETPVSILSNVLQGLALAQDLAERGTLEPTLLVQCLARWQVQLQAVVAQVTGHEVTS